MKIKLLLPGAVLYALLFIVFIHPLTSRAQEKTNIIKGTVRGATDLPVAGASVIIKGTETGTITNQQGEFSLNAPGNATLVITAVDHEPNEVKVNNRSVLAISLKQLEKALNEVVVIGYGTQRKKDV